MSISSISINCLHAVCQPHCVNKNYLFEAQMPFLIKVFLVLVIRSAILIKNKNKKKNHFSIPQFTKKKIQQEID